MPLSRARWLPEALLRFSGAHPGIAIAVVEGSYAELAPKLRDGEIDLMLGALRDPAALDDLAQEQVFVDRLALIMRAGHPLAGEARPDGARLAAWPWIVPARPTPLRRYWEEMMRAAGAETPRVWIECGSVLTIRELLVGSDALTLLSPAQLAVELADGILQDLPPPHPVERPIGMLHRLGWRPTDAQAAFMAILREGGARKDFA
jgi:DNA-binding transcriptional LysR family regulator